MKFKKKAVFYGIVILLALVFTLPAARDELDWRWTESRDQATDYMRYLEDWPKGRHVVEAKARYDKRSWKETERAMINEALKKHATGKPDPDALKERKVRNERFYWKQVTVENTVVSYQEYLQRYPGGEFAAQAQRQIDGLTGPAPGGKAGTNSTSQ